MTRYIDADDFENVMYHEAFEIDTEMQRWDSGCWIRYKLFENLLEKQPTADVVEVIRCEDCKWYKSIFSWNGNEHKICVREPSEPPREPDDYCSYGEGREDAK